MAETQRWWCYTCNQWRGAKAKFCQNCSASRDTPYAPTWTEDPWVQQGQWQHPNTWQDRRRRTPSPRRLRSPRGRGRENADKGKGKGKGKDKSGKTAHQPPLTPGAPQIGALPAPPTLPALTPPSAVSVPNPDAAPSEAQCKLDALINSLVSVKETLPPAVMQALGEHTASSTAQESKILHQWVNAKTKARKELAKLRTARATYFVGMGRLFGSGPQCPGNAVQRTGHNACQLPRGGSQVDGTAQGSDRHPLPAHQAQTGGACRRGYGGRGRPPRRQDQRVCSTRSRTGQEAPRTTADTAKRSSRCSKGWSRDQAGTLPYTKAHTSGWWVRTCGSQYRRLSPWLGPVTSLVMSTGPSVIAGGNGTPAMGFGAWHSVRHEVDYVSPLYAAFLGAVQQFEVTLTDLGHSAFCANADPRINAEVLPAEDVAATLTVRSGPCMLPSQVHGAGNDGQPPVEPSLVHGSLHQSKWAAGVAACFGESDKPCSVQSVFPVHTCELSPSRLIDARTIRTARLGRPALRTVGAHTNARKSPLRKVRFAFAIQFWFPSSLQVCLPKGCLPGPNGHSVKLHRPAPSGIGTSHSLEGCIPSSVDGLHCCADHPATPFSPAFEGHFPSPVGSVAHPSCFPLGHQCLTGDSSQFTFAPSMCGVEPSPHPGLLCLQVVEPTASVASQGNHSAAPSMSEVEHNTGVLSFPSLPPLSSPLSCVDTVPFTRWNLPAFVAPSMSEVELRTDACVNGWPFVPSIPGRPPLKGATGSALPAREKALVPSASTDQSTDQPVPHTPGLIGQIHGLATDSALAQPLLTTTVTAFDTVLHYKIHTVRQDDTLADVVRTILANSPHLPEPLSFRVSDHNLPGFPTPQLAIWTEPNPGHRVIPVALDSLATRVCTVNIPFDASPFAVAIELELRCAGVERLRYLLASRVANMLADGARTEPFLAGQFVDADFGLISTTDPLDIPPPIQDYVPASFILPAQLSEARFASRSDDIVVHRHGTVPLVVQAHASLGPQQLLNRLLAILGMPSSARLSFPATMPVEVPSRLHVVVGSRDPPASPLVPVLADLRRVAIPPTVHWCIIFLPLSCRQQEVYAALATQCGPLLPIAAAYLNFDMACNRAIGVQRHTVVTPVGHFPVQGLDLVTTDGAFAPICLGGCDVAALRSGLARFLAVPARSRATSTSTTTTGSFALPRPGPKSRNSRRQSQHRGLSSARPLSEIGHTQIAQTPTSLWTHTPPLMRSSADASFSVLTPIVQISAALHFVPRSFRDIPLLAPCKPSWSDYPAPKSRLPVTMLVSTAGLLSWTLHLLEAISRCMMCCLGRQF